MHPNLSISQVRLSPGERRFLFGAWVVIVAKCVLVRWAFDHWNVPLSAWWIILPTLVFAALATILWLTHEE